MENKNLPLTTYRFSLKLFSCSSLSFQTQFFLYFSQAADDLQNFLLKFKVKLLIF